MREDIRQVLMTHFTAGWAAGGELCPVYPQNQKQAEDAAAWGRFSLAWGENTPSAIGTGFLRCFGMIYLQIFMPSNTGTKIPNQAADKLEAMFLDQRFELAAGGRQLLVQIESGADGPREVPSSQGWVQYNISLDFRVETAR